jgi:hypothetical protein
LTQDQARQRIAQILWIVLLLICLQYLFAFAWAALRPSTDIIDTLHPFTWSSLHNFSDLMDYQQKLGKPRSPALQSQWPVWNYPPVAATVYYALLNAPLVVVSFLSIVIVGLLSVLTYFCVAVHRLVPPMRVRTVAILVTSATVVLSYPFQYVYWRANIEGIVFVLCAWGLISFCRRRNWTAATLWGLAVCLKPYSGLLLLLLLRRRQYKAFLWAVALFVVLQVAGLYFFAPSLADAYKIYQAGIQTYSSFYVHYFRLNEARFQHSLLDSMKATVALCGHWQALASYEGKTQKVLFSAYLVLAPATAAATAFVFWRKPLLNQCLAILCLPLLLAPVSADYTTIAMHMCWGLVVLWLLMDVASGPQRITRGTLIACFVPFTILFAPQNWLSYYAGILHTAALSAFLIVAACIRMPSSLFQDLSADPSAGL